MLRRAKSAPAGPAGRARVGKRTKDLIKRIEPGEIAVIDHADLDRVAADGLVAAGVAAVVNAKCSVTGRYPNQGPLRVLDAGIPLVDEVGTDLLDELDDGEVITVAEGDICVGRQGRRLGPAPRAGGAGGGHRRGPPHDRRGAAALRREHVGVRRARRRS